MDKTLLFLIKIICLKNFGAQRRKLVKEEEVMHEALLKKMPKLTNYFAALTSAVV